MHPTHWHIEHKKKLQKAIGLPVEIAGNPVVILMLH
jgi:hypothetical protein